jgi:hypothetical protein
MSKDIQVLLSCDWRKWTASTFGCLKKRIRDDLGDPPALILVFKSARGHLVRAALACK